MRRDRKRNRYVGKKYSEKSEGIKMAMDESHSQKNRRKVENGNAGMVPKSE